LKDKICFVLTSEFSVKAFLLNHLRAMSAQYDVTVVVNGGGVTGQTDAVRLGVARALLLINGDWTAALRKFGLLTRDARIKERNLFALN